MKIYPLDIRRQTFKNRLRGADPDEVRTFLELVANDFEAVLQENAMQAERVKTLDERLEEYRLLEQSMRNSLVTAERIVNEARDSSEREAQRILQDAQARAERILTDARERLALLHQEIELLRGKRDVFVRRFATMLESELAVLQEHAPGGGDPAYGGGGYLGPHGGSRAGHSSYSAGQHSAGQHSAGQHSAGQHSAGQHGGSSAGPFAVREQGGAPRSSAPTRPVEEVLVPRPLPDGLDPMASDPLGSPVSPGNTFSARPRVPIRRAEPVPEHPPATDLAARGGAGDGTEAAARGFGRTFRRSDGVLPIPEVVPGRVGVSDAGAPPVVPQPALPLRERREGVLEFSALEGRPRDPETSAGS